MKTTISSSRLKAGLAFVSRILVRNSISTIVLRNGSIEASSSHGKASFKVGEFDFAVGLKPDPIQAILASGADEIIVDTSGQQVLLQAGNLKLKASKADLDGLADYRIEKTTVPVKLSTEFREAVAWASLMAHRDEYSGKDHVLLDNHAGELAVVGFDGSNGTAQLCGGECGFKDSLFLPLHAASMVAQLNSEAVMATDYKLIEFRTEDSSFICPLFQDRMAARYSMIMERLSNPIGTVDRKELLGLLNAYLKVHAPSGVGAALACAVGLEVKDGWLRLVSNGDQFDGAVPLGGTSGASEPSVVANGLTLSTALGAMDCERVSIGINDKYSPITITPEGESWKVWMGMPMREK